MLDLAAAAADGLMGAATLIRICVHLDRLRLAERPMLDILFTDRLRLAQLHPDELIEMVAEAVERLRPDLAASAERRARDQRRLSTRFEDGILIGFFQLDGEAGTTLLEALNAAAPAPTGPNDTTRDARRPPDPDEPDDPDELWALRARQRQHADALLRLAEHYLTHNPTPSSSDAGGDQRAPTGSSDDTGSDDTGSSDTGSGDTDVCGNAADPAAAAAAAAAAAVARRRSRPRMLVWAELGLLTGDTHQARAARLLANHIGGPVRPPPRTWCACAAGTTPRSPTAAGSLP